MAYEEMKQEQTAVIPQGTVIHGSIATSDRLELYGIVEGNIQSTERVNLCGTVTGNVAAQDFVARDSWVEGDIVCKSGAVIQENTVVLGNIQANNLKIDGAVQGALDVQGCVTIGEKAVVDSHIRARSIQVSNGAAINGKLELCYADVKMDEIFPKPAKQGKAK